VVLGGADGEPVADLAATSELRGRLAAQRPASRPFFDRGPGYAALSGGAAAADVDWL
jgi:N-methylhydantoinase B